MPTGDVVSAGLKAFQEVPLSVEYSKFVMSVPPFVVGAVKATDADTSPAVPTTFVGANGTGFTCIVTTFDGTMFSPSARQLLVVVGQILRLIRPAESV